MTAESLKLTFSSSEDEEDKVTSEHNDGGTSSTSKLDEEQMKRNLTAAFKQIFKNVNGYMKQNKNGDWVPVNEDDPKSQKPVDMMVSSVALHGGLPGCWLTNSILDGANSVMERVENSSKDRNMERETIEWLRDAVLEQQQHFKVLCDAAFEKGQAVATASIQGLATEKTALEKSNQQLNEKIKHLETIRTEHQTQEACDKERIRKLESEVEELKTQLEATKRSATGGNADGESPGEVKKLLLRALRRLDTVVDGQVSIQKDLHQLMNGLNGELSDDMETDTEAGSSCKKRKKRTEEEKQTVNPANDSQTQDWSENEDRQTSVPSGAGGSVQLGAGGSAPSGAGGPAPSGAKESVPLVAEGSVPSGVGGGAGAETRKLKSAFPPLYKKPCEECGHQINPDTHSPITGMYEGEHWKKGKCQYDAGVEIPATHKYSLHLLQQHGTINQDNRRDLAWVYGILHNILLKRSVDRAARQKAKKQKVP